MPPTAAPPGSRSGRTSRATPTWQTTTRRSRRPRRAASAQLEPGAEQRLVVIGLDGPHRAAQDRRKALNQFLAPVRAREDMHVAAECDHGVEDIELTTWQAGNHADGCDWDR